MKKGQKVSKFTVENNHGNQNNQQINFNNDGDVIYSPSSEANLSISTGEHLLEKKKVITVPKLILVDLIALLANVFTVVVSYKSLIEPYIGTFDFLNQLSVAAVVCFPAAIVIMFLCISTYYLLASKRYGSFIRKSSQIYYIKKLKCPSCGGKPKLQWDKGGALIACKDNPRDHIFPIDHTQL